MPSLDEILEKYPFVQRDNLIQILQDIQDQFGYLSEEAIIRVGKYLNIPTSKIFGLASFYHHFRFRIAGKYHIKICNGSSCNINRNVLIIKEIEKKLGIKNEEITKDGIFSIEETACMAACGEGPIMLINKTPFTNLTTEKVSGIIDSYKRMEE